MTALWAIASEYRTACETLAELDLDVQTVADTLEAIGGEFEDKAQNVAYVIRSLDAEGESCRAWAMQAEAHSKALHARANSLRDYLAITMTACGIERISGPGVLLSFRKSTAVIINNIELLPAAYMRQPPLPPPSPDKASIADAIKAGIEVPGAEIETRHNLQIK